MTNCFNRAKEKVLKPEQYHSVKRRTTNGKGKLTKTDDTNLSVSYPSLFKTYEEYCKGIECDEESSSEPEDIVIDN